MDPVIVVGGARVFAGDCREALKHLPDNSVDSVVTDPPYELGFMGKSWDSSGIAYDPAVWAECLRVLKPGGHILAFGGSRTWHRLAVAVEDAGFELRDSIAWIYGSGFPKSLDVSKAIDKAAGVERDVVTEKRIDLFGEEDSQVSVTDRREDGTTYGLGHSGKLTVKNAITSEAKAWEGWGTALKPAFEPVVVGRKPFGKGVTVAENILAWGVGGLNIDRSRIQGLAGESFARPVNHTNQHEGWQRPWHDNPDSLERERAKRDESEAKAQSLGRWPANVIFDEVTAGLLDEQTGVLKSGAFDQSKNTVENRIYGAMPKNRSKLFEASEGGASRFFYVAKASKRDRNEGLEELEAVRHADRVVDDGPGGENPRNRTNQAKQNFHPTVKPTALMRYLIKLVTPEGGVVLDPFTGSGSTGKAALLDGFQFVGVELTEEYLPIIEGRLRWASEQVEDDGTLF
jgi:site-specific DNA-methyltransferase (adenine-specific)